MSHWVLCALLGPGVCAVRQAGEKKLAAAARAHGFTQGLSRVQSVVAASAGFLDGVALVPPAPVRFSRPLLLRYVHTYPQTHCATASHSLPQSPACVARLLVVSATRARTRNNAFPRVIFHTHCDM